MSRNLQDLGIFLGSIKNHLPWNALCGNNSSWCVRSLSVDSVGSAARDCKVIECSDKGHSVGFILPFKEEVVMNLSIKVSLSAIGPVCDGYRGWIPWSHAGISQGMYFRIPLKPLESQCFRRDLISSCVFSLALKKFANVRSLFFRYFVFLTLS